MLSDSNRITPVGLTTATLAGYGVGSMVTPAGKFIKKKLEGTAVDKFTTKQVDKVKNAKATVSTRVKNAWSELFPKNEAKKIVKHKKGFKGALRKAKVQTKVFVRKFVKPALKQLKKPSVHFPIIGAIAGAAIYIVSNKTKEADY